MRPKATFTLLLCLVAGTVTSQSNGHNPHEETIPKKGHETRTHNKYVEASSVPLLPSPSLIDGGIGILLAIGMGYSLKTTKRVRRR